MSFILKTKNFFISFLFKKWPSISQWLQLPETFKKEEKIVFSFFLILFSSSLIFLGINFYFKNTLIKPAEGGFFTEGVVGQPRFINPLYGISDIDRDLIELIFSGLMKHTLEGKIVPDLAKKEPKIKEDGKIFEFYLKENLFWSDGHPLTADDVVFTIETIQNPDLKSPLRPAWLGVEVEKISETAIRFRLRRPYFPFLENATLKIIPKHIWQALPIQNFHLAIYNLKPIGSGPYKLKRLGQDQLGIIRSLTLTRNERYHGQKPNIKKINFIFFEEENDLIKKVEENRIDSFSLAHPKYFKNIDNSLLVYRFSLPRYFAVFFNPEKSEILAQKQIRRALNYATNKKEIAEKIFTEKARIVESPILPDIYAISPPDFTYQFNLKKAEEILDEIGFLKRDDGKREKIIKKEPAFQFKSNLSLNSRGIEVRKLQECLAGLPKIYPEGEITGHFGQKTRKAVIKFQEKYPEEILKPFGLKKGTGRVLEATRLKLNEICFPSKEEKIPLKFSLVTVNQPILKDVSFLLKNQWQLAGFELELIFVEISDLEKDFIRPREYEAILFGQAMGILPDPFPFWHSLQKENPGLNLALYHNREVDRLLERIRENQNEEARKKELEEFQNILIEEAPAVFLVNPDYLYFVSPKIKGIKEGIIVNPSKRFIEIENWYLKTKRVWK